MLWLLYITNGYHRYDNYIDYIDYISLNHDTHGYCSWGPQDHISIGGSTNQLKTDPHCTIVSKNYHPFPKNIAVW